MIFTSSEKQKPEKILNLRGGIGPRIWNAVQKVEWQLKKAHTEH